MAAKKKTAKLGQAFKANELRMEPTGPSRADTNQLAISFARGEETGEDIFPFLKQSLQIQKTINICIN